MYQGSRVTDEAAFHVRRGEVKGAVRIVRKRVPESFRWRKAVAGVNTIAGGLRGLDRMRVEEPIREMVLDLGDESLQCEVILDARKAGIDLDRGEVLPFTTLADLRRLSFLAGVDVQRVGRYVKLPSEFHDRIDTPACVVIGRTLAEFHRRRAHKLWLRVPDPEGPVPLMKHHHLMLKNAERDRFEAERWAALAKALIKGG